MPIPTRRGIGFSLLTVLLYLAAAQTRMGWLYLITAAMIIVLSSSFVIPWIGLRTLSVTRSVGRPGGPYLARIQVSEEDGVDVHLNLQIKRACPLVSITDHCELDAPDKQEKVFFCWLIEGTATSLTYSVVCDKRGYHTLGAVKLGCSGPFGLFHYRRGVPALTKVKVLPWHLSLQQVPHPVSSASSADHVKVVRGGNVEVFATREYRKPDPLRAIHWRSTARRGQLIVKEFAQPEPMELAIVLDSSTEFGSYKDTTLEYSVKVAASLTHVMHMQGKAVRLIASGFPSAPLNYAQALDFLTGLKATSTAEPLPLLLRRVGTARDVIVLSPSTPSVEMLMQPVIGRRLWMRVAFLGFEEDGLPSLAQPLPGVLTMPWSKWQAPAEVISAIITAYATSHEAQEW
ncbi:MAG: DUF58 domain-containing protein [Chloroflexi bacterium]|nr:DUF58 domain-containing protein [Chloroflexota bacterium]